jgi:hypothetical protein
MKTIRLRWPPTRAACQITAGSTELPPSVGQVGVPASAVVLSQRRVPGSRRTIDRIAVSPAGVFVIGTTLRPDALREEVDVVAAVLGISGLDVPLHGILCLTRTPRRRPFRMGDLVCARPEALAELIGGRPHPAMPDVDDVVAGLADLLPAA